jgi:hypothetical protein
MIHERIRTHGTLSARLAGLALLPLLAVACTQTAGGPPPGMTAAQADAYCNKLAWSYSEYVAGGTVEGANDDDGTDADINARLAIARCHDGDTAAAIPVLQKELRRNKLPVPAI